MWAGIIWFNGVVIKKALLCALILGLSALASAESKNGFSARLNAFVESLPRSKRPAPLFEGLPAEISGAMDGYDDFPDSREAPVFANEALLDGRIASDLELAQFFTEDRGLRLPPNARIVRRSIGANHEFWDYPVGTRFVHSFFLKADPGRIFELRLIEKRPDGHWAFGVYVPEPNGKLRLMREMEHVSLRLARSGRPAQLEMDRLHPESCRTCHWMHSTANHYMDEETAGPCGFGPFNQSILSEWAVVFKAKHGYGPFANP